MNQTKNASCLRDAHAYTRAHIRPRSLNTTNPYTSPHPPTHPMTPFRCPKTEEVIFTSSGAANRKQTLQRFLGHASDAEIKFKRALGEGGRDRGGRTGDWRSGVLGQLETVITVTKV